jgi:hypothetical protein
MASWLPIRARNLYARKRVIARVRRTAERPATANRQLERIPLTFTCSLCERKS